MLPADTYGDSDFETAADMAADDAPWLTKGETAADIFWAMSRAALAETFGDAFLMAADIVATGTG